MSTRWSVALPQSSPLVLLWRLELFWRRDGDLGLGGGEERGIRSENRVEEGVLGQRERVLRCC